MVTTSTQTKMTLFHQLWLIHAIQVSEAQYVMHDYNKHLAVPLESVVLCFEACIDPTYRVVFM